MTYKEIYYFTGQCLSLEAQPGFREQFIERIRQEDFPWEGCLELWSDHLIIPAIYFQFQKHQFLPLLPQCVSQVMATIYFINCQRNASIVQQAHRLNQALAGRKIHPVFLKGTANLLDGLYDDLGERMIHNIDLLVSESDYLPAAKILRDMGYTHGRGAYVDYKTLKHFPSLFKKEEPAVVQIHRLPVPAPWAGEFSPAMLFRDRKAVAGSPGIYVPCDAHKLIHTFIHSQLADRGQAYKQSSFRGFNDLYRLSKRMDVFGLVSATPYQTKAVAWMSFAQAILQLPRRFYPLKTRDARWLTWTYDLSLSHSVIYAMYSFAKKALDLLFVRYAALWWKILFQQSERQSVYGRLKNPQWHATHVFSSRQIVPIKTDYTN